MKLGMASGDDALAAAGNGDGHDAAAGEGGAGDAKPAHKMSDMEMKMGLNNHGADEGGYDL